MRNILILGFGNIGYRHAQSILKSKIPLTLCVVDPVEKYNSLLINNNKKIIVNFYTDIQNVKIKKFDIIIFSTTSSERYFLFKKSLKLFKFKYCIFEKVVFQNNYQFKDALKMIKRFKIKAWVNCPMRIYPVFKYIKKKIKNKNFNLEVKGSKINIASNIIHYLDLFIFLKKNDFNIKTKTKLKQNIIKSKRKGYIEIRGIVNFIDNFNNSLSVEDKGKNISEEICTIKTKDKKFIFENNYLSIFHKTKKIFYANYKHLYQSDLTSLVVEDIFKTKKCNLTTLAESSKQHSLIFPFINDHLLKITKKKYINCPIT